MDPRGSTLPLQKLHFPLQLPLLLHYLTPLPWMLLLHYLCNISILVFMPPPADSSTLCKSLNPIASPLDDLHLPTAFHKGKHSCTIYLISYFVHYDDFHPTYHTFSLSLTTKPVPKSHLEAQKLPYKKVVMDLDYDALVQRKTWVLVSLLADVHIVA